MSPAALLCLHPGRKGFEHLHRVQRARLRQEVQAALEAAGCAHIACNAITANNAAKALLRVAEEEGFPLPKEQARFAVPLLANRESPPFHRVLVP